MEKKNKKKKYNNCVMRLILVGSMMICIVVAMVTYWLFAYNYRRHYNINDKIISNKISDYVYVEGKRVYLKNIDSDIENKFLKEENKIIENNDILDINISKNLNNNILSVKIEYVLYDKDGNYEEVLTTNIDLEENKIIDNDSMIEMSGSSYKEIATSIFNEYIKIDNNVNRDYVIDSVTDKKLTREEFNNNSLKYIIRIRETLPDIISTYMIDDKVYYMVRLSTVQDVCYYTDIDTRMNYIDKEIGKIRKEEL